MEEELKRCAAIQRDCCPHLPSQGCSGPWVPASPSQPSGGDYFDVRPIGGEAWALTVTDVRVRRSCACWRAAARGVSLAPRARVRLPGPWSRINRFLNERTQGEKYAHRVYCTVSAMGCCGGRMRGIPSRCWCGAAESLTSFKTNGTAAGMLDLREYGVEQVQLQPGPGGGVQRRVVGGGEFRGGVFRSQAAVGDVEGRMRGWMVRIATRG